jgi:hypothetical protein
MIGTSRSLAISSNRRQLRTWNWRSSSSVDDQSNTGTSVVSATPVSLTACFTSAMAASSAFG